MSLLQCYTIYKSLILHLDVYSLLEFSLMNKQIYNQTVTCLIRRVKNDMNKNIKRIIEYQLLYSENLISLTNAKKCFLLDSFDLMNLPRYNNETKYKIKDVFKKCLDFYHNYDTFKDVKIKKYKQLCLTISRNLELIKKRTSRIQKFKRQYKPTPQILFQLDNDIQRFIKGGKPTITFIEHKTVTLLRPDSRRIYR